MENIKESTEQEQDKVPGYLKEITEDWEKQGVKNFVEEYKSKQLSPEQMNDFYKCQGDPEKILAWHRKHTPWIKDFSVLRNIMLSYKMEYDQLKTQLAQFKKMQSEFDELCERFKDQSGIVAKRDGLCECTFVRIKTQTPEGSNLYDNYCTCEGRFKDELKLKGLVE